MIKKVTEYAAKWKMLRKEDKVIAGVSGGADSVCLLFVLLELRKKIGFGIVVVHVNHQLRGEAALRDECYVEELCKREGLLCEICREDVELIAKNRKQSLEEAGRNVRREAFMAALRKHGATKIALAHHKNDNAETLLMNLARGSGLKGLGGMQPVSGVMIRPLLCLERKEIEEYLKKQDVSYCTDETNSSDEYTRNRIRNHILPSLEREVNAKAVAHISETMEMLSGVQRYLEAETERYYRECVRRTDKNLLIIENPYENLPDIFQNSVIKKALACIAGAEKDIHAAHIGSVAELMTKQTGRRINLPYQITAKRCYEGVRLFRDMEMEETGSKAAEIAVDLSKDGEIRRENFVLRHWTAGAEEIEYGKNEKIYTKCFDYDIMKCTIHLRTRLPGDYLTLDHTGKTQKLKSYFINEKIPQEERDRILLLAEGNHVLWVIGYRRGYAYPLKKGAKKIIKIKIDKGENYYGRDS